MEIKELSKDEFRQFTNNFNPSSIYQTYEYGMVMKNQNFEVLYLGMIDDQKTIVAASLIIIEKLSKFKYAYAPRGFLIDYTKLPLLEEFTNLIKAYFKKKNVIAIKICPIIPKARYIKANDTTISSPIYDEIFNNLKKLKYYHLGYNHFFEALKPRFEAIAHLNKDTSKMFKDLHDDYKRKITEADLAGVRIYKGNTETLDTVYEMMRDKKAKSKDYVNDMYNYFNDIGTCEVYYAQLETQKYLVNTQVEYQKQINICNKITDELFKNQGNQNNEIINQKIKEDNHLEALKKQIVYATNILREHPKGIIIATAMIIKYRGQVYLTIDGQDMKYKHLGAKHLLIWKLMELLAQEGYTEFNLGGITDPQYEGENKYKGGTDFKLNFNASSLEYAGDFELVTNYPLYTLYRNTSPIRHILKK